MSNLSKGDKVILVKSTSPRFGLGVMDKPVVAKVARVTRTGQFYTNLKGLEKVRFNPNSRDAWNCYAVPVEKYSSWEAHLHSEEKFSELLDKHHDNVKARSSRAAEQQRKADERERERQDQIDTVKALIPSGVMSHFVCQTMPDGTRLYTGTVPVKENLRERKGGWSWMAVKCKDVEELDWDAERVDGERPIIQKVEFAVTYADGNSHSFPSCSCEKVDTDEEALLEAARYVHFNW